MSQDPSSLQLPVIDVAMLRSPIAAERNAAVAAIGAAARRHGFFYARNHGVDPALQRQVFAQSRAFFALPETRKVELDKALSPCNRGYERLRDQTLEAGAPPDLKEGFYMGEDLGADDPQVAAGRFNQGPNQWPGELPEFRTVMMAYYEAMMALAATLMGGVADAMQLPAPELEAYMHAGMGTLRLLHYPPQPPNPAPGEKGCGAHTDFGGLTLLMQDDSGGLQVQDEDSGEWLEAPPLPGCYVINLGDLIARWTNRRFRSDMHRVINRSGRDRYSVPFFFSGNPDYMVDCLSWCLDADEASRLPPITVEQHLRDCYKSTYA